MHFSFDRLTYNRYYSRPMKQPLPQHIDPFRLANRSERLTGQLRLQDMERLGSMIVSTDAMDGLVDVELDFAVDHSRIRHIQGQIKASLTVVCQRCLKPMDYTVDIKVALGLIKQREQADRLPIDYEPLLVETDEILLQDIIEDEIILTMPGAPMHDTEHDACQGTTKDFSSVKGSQTDGSTHDSHAEAEADVDGNARQKRKNPFAVLADFKAKRRS